METPSMELLQKRPEGQDFSYTNLVGQPGLTPEEGMLVSLRLTPEAIERVGTAVRSGVLGASEAEIFGRIRAVRTNTDSEDRFVIELQTEIEERIYREAGGEVEDRMIMAFESHIWSLR